MSSLLSNLQSRLTKLGYDRNVTEEHVRAAVSPPGKLDLPKALLTPLLEQRRLEYEIPDGTFRVMPASDTVYVWQVGHVKYDGVIIETDNKRDHDRNASPTGILVGAGLLALDQLRSHGIDLGHRVRLLRMSPFRMETCYVGSQMKDVLVMHAGDIKGSEDTMEQLRSGELVLEQATEMTAEGVPVARHFYRRADGTVLNPIKPWAPEEI